MLFPETSPFESKARELTAKEKPSTIPDEAHVYAATPSMIPPRTPVENEVLAGWYERINDRILQDGSDGELEDLRDDIYSYLRG
jgi:hypothetical protein